MSARALLQRFDIVADHSSNIPALRRLVVDLAVRGKLLPTELFDISAQDMLKRIFAKADELAVAGDIKKAKPSSKIGNEEVPAAYLAHCTFVRLGNVANLQKGLTGIQSSRPGQFPLVATAAERGTCDHFDFDGAAAIIPLVSSTGHGNASINRLHYQEGKFALGTILCAVFPFDEQLISARFLFEYLMAFKEKLLVSKMIGTANVTLTLGKIADVPVPIVPPAVQKRVDELMVLCDQLEAAQQERERRRDRLAAASLQRLKQPAADTTPDVQREHARFHLNQLSRLTTRPENIKAMRQIIRSLAICGRLLPQDSRDVSAAKFLKEVTAGRDKLEKTGEIREAKSLNSIDLDMTPFPLPKGWEWARFGELINHSDAGISPKTEGFARSGDQWGVLKVSAVSWDRFRPEENKQLFQGLVPPDFAHVQAGDFLISRANTRELVAKCVIVNEKPVKLILSDKTVRLRLTGLGNPGFWSLVNNHADYARAYYAEEASGTSDSMKNVSRSIIYNLLMPIPPLAEQHRIVAKVDELMSLCDQLEAQLTTTQTDSRRLLEAVLEAALVPA